MKKKKSDTAEIAETVTPKATAKPKRARLENRNPGNGALGAVATPLQKDVAAWRAIGWIDAE